MVTRDEIAALLDGATPETGHDELIRRLDRWGGGALGHHWIGKRSAAQDCLDAGMAIRKLRSAAAAAIAAMDREAALVARVAEYDNEHERQAQTIMMLQATIAALRAKAAMATPDDDGMVVHPDGSTGPVTLEYAKDYHVRMAPGWAPSITPDIRDTGETIWRCSMDNWTTGDAVGAESTISGAHAWVLAVEKAAKVREHG